MTWRDILVLLLVLTIVLVGFAFGSGRSVHPESSSCLRCLVLGDGKRALHALLHCRFPLLTIMARPLSMISCFGVVCSAWPSLAQVAAARRYTLVLFPPGSSILHVAATF